MKARRATSFLFEPGAFAGDPVVLAMNPTEVGAYILLLCAAWTFPEPGVVPDNDQALSHLTRTGPDWPQCRAAVALAFDTTSRPGFWIQKRMVQTHKHQSGWFARQTLAGALGGKAKAANEKARLARVVPLGLATGTGSGTGSCSGSGTGEGETKKRQKRESRPRAKPVMPSLEEAVAFAHSECPTVDGERWWNYQAARGWKTKAGPIVDWHAAMRTWVNNGYDSQPSNGNGRGRGGYLDGSAVLAFAKQQRKDEEAVNG